MRVRQGREKRDIADAFANPEQEFDALAGEYHKLLGPYYERFDPDHIHITLFDDMKSDPAGVIRSLYGFLGVNENFPARSGEVHKRGGLPKSPAAKFLLDTVRRLARSNSTAFIRKFIPKEVKVKLQRSVEEKTLFYPKVDPDIRRMLINYFRDDISSLAKLTGRDLSHWLESRDGRKNLSGAR